MSDTPLNEAPAIDVERVHADHEKWMATINELDPASLYYKRPDLAAKARDEAQLQHEARLVRYGIAPPPPRTPETIATEKFRQDWKFTDQRAPFEVEYEARVEAAAAKMSKEAHEAAVKALQLRIGGARYDQLAASTLTMPSAPRAFFAAMEGARKHAELVEQAKATLAPGQTLPRGVLVDEQALSLRAAHGRAILAREADRARMRG